MSTNLSLHQMLTQLEARIADHRAQLAFHASRQQFHEEKKALHEAELQSALERYETLRTASVSAGKYLDQARPGAAPPSSPEIEPDSRRGSLSRMIAYVVESRGPGEVFGTATVTEEIRQRWGAKLHRRSTREASPPPSTAGLREGGWRFASEGRAHHEALSGARRAGARAAARFGNLSGGFTAHRKPAI